MKNKLIYVANSEKSMTHLLEYIFFSKEGYTVKTFVSGKDLIANLNKNPDIVIMDQAFNAGLDTLKGIKQHKKELKVIILSGDKEKEIEKEFIENGDYTYIPKSGFFVDKILETIDLALPVHNLSF